MILIRELSTAFSVEAGTISCCNGSMQEPDRRKGICPEAHSGAAAAGIIAKVDICAARRALYAARAQKKVVLIGKSAAAAAFGRCR
jgi:hypothetical protein